MDGSSMLKAMLIDRLSGLRMLDARLLVTDKFNQKDIFLLQQSFVAISTKLH